MEERADELRRLASNYLRRERGEHTLQPTALVNEAYLKLIDQRNPKWRNRAHFFGISAQLMRRILVDHARQHQAVKRGGSAQQRISITSVEKIAQQPEIDLLALNEALDELAQTLRMFFAALGTEPTLPVEGSYFISTDISALGYHDDGAFCRWLTAELGVAAIPTSAFYTDPASAPPFARFCFAKKRATLEAAGERLQRLAPQRGIRLEPTRVDAVLDLATLPAWEISRPRSWESLPEAGRRLLELASTTPTAEA